MEFIPTNNVMLSLKMIRVALLFGFFQTNKKLETLYRFYIHAQVCVNGDHRMDRQLVIFVLLHVVLRLAARGEAQLESESFRVVLVGV